MLVEHAVEQGGQGFIPNAMESFRLTYPVLNGFNVELRSFNAPLISPQLLFYMMKSSRAQDAFNRAVSDFTSWFLGFFDPVDFLITDLLGRRLGHTRSLGEINEIPDAFHSGDGDLEHVVIPRPIPGPYRVVLEGLGEPVLASFGNDQAKQTFARDLADGEVIETQFIVEPYAGGPGDVDGNGFVDAADRTALEDSRERFTNGLSDPADLNGDGMINDADLLVFDQVTQSLVAVPPSDFDHNGEVDEGDLLRIQAAFGACEGDDHYEEMVDLANGDDCIDFRDYYLWLNRQEEP